MTLLATLSFHETDKAKFRAYERKAVAIMAKHGGRIEQAFFGRDEDAKVCKEIHVVRFPSEDAFEAFRNDQALRDLAGERAECVLETHILTCEEEVDYSIGASL